MAEPEPKAGPEAEPPQEEAAAPIVVPANKSFLPYVLVLVVVCVGGWLYAMRFMHKAEEIPMSAEELKALNSQAAKKQEAPQEVVEYVQEEPTIEKAGLSNVVEDTGRSAEDLARPLAQRQTGQQQRKVVRIVRKAAAPNPWELLWQDPAGYLTRQTLLGSAPQFQAWLNNPGKVKAYFDAPLVGQVLNSPETVKQVLGNAAIVAAFVGSPAMSDPATVKAAVSSSFARELMSKPGVRQALNDPAVRSNLLTQSATADWLTRNPEAMSLLKQGR